ncbi:MAG: LuxR C-terminal-related transcriptional regulator [Pseudobdellovibrionaceae bacterium]
MLRDALIQKGLSNREAEVAELVSKGLSNKEVANQLFVTEKTVKFHLTNIYKKMSVKSRAQLIVWCLPHLGFVESESRQEIANNNTPITAAGYNNGYSAAAATQAIPAGNSTVGGSAANMNQTTTLPASSTIGNRSGNGDIGMGF